MACAGERVYRRVAPRIGELLCVHVTPSFSHLRRRRLVDAGAAVVPVRLHGTEDVISPDDLGARTEVPGVPAWDRHPVELRLVGDMIGVIRIAALAIVGRFA